MHCKTKYVFQKALPFEIKGSALRKSDMESIIHLDQQLFLLINHLPHGRILDTAAQFLSGVGTAGIIWFIFGIIVIYKEERKDHWFFLPLVLAGGVSWFLVELLLKPLIARARPSFEMGSIIVGKQSYDLHDFSFPSGHATIAFAMAVVLSFKEPKLKWLWYSLAVLIAFSRIYLGRHYPLDVVCGGLVGWGIGMLAIKISQRLSDSS